MRASWLVGLWACALCLADMVTTIYIQLLLLCWVRVLHAQHAQEAVLCLPAAYVHVPCHGHAHAPTSIFVLKGHVHAVWRCITHCLKVTPSRTVRQCVPQAAAAVCVRCRPGVTPGPSVWLFVWDFNEWVLCVCLCVCLPVCLLGLFQSMCVPVGDPPCL